MGVMSSSQAPPPPDDGAYDHVLGAAVPSVSLPSTTGGTLDVCDSLAAFTVLFLYPMTGTPGKALPEGWTEIPGAVGCTPQSCAYRDLIAEFEALDASVRGISTQTPEEQAEFATREHIPYPLLSDSNLRLATAMALPTFEAGGKARLKRASLIVRDRSVLRVLYPVLDPAANAGHTLTAVRELLASPRASSTDD
jgi:peroxiredoxin